LDYYNPYGQIGKGSNKWLKCNFHVHGDNMPMNEILRHYKVAGYDLIMFSQQKDFEDTSLLAEQAGISTVNGQEYVELDGLLLVGTHRHLSGRPQQVVDACNAQGGFAIICHPNELDIPLDRIPPILPKEQSRLLEGVVGLEVYNGCTARTAVEDYSLGFGLASDFWDELLSEGRKLWGFGSDDFHDMFEMNVGWTYVCAASTRFVDIKSAVLAGRLYASSGLFLHHFSLDRQTIRAVADYPYGKPLGKTLYRFVGENGRILKEERGGEGVYTIKGGEPYVRLEAMGPDGSFLWCQPLLHKDFFD